MPYTKEPSHIKTTTKTLKDGTVKTYTYDNKKLNDNAKIKNIFVACECGQVVKKYSKLAHTRTEKHQKQMLNRPLQIPAVEPQEELIEYSKRPEIMEKRRIYAREYYRRKNPNVIEYRRKKYEGTIVYQERNFLIDYLKQLDIANRQNKTSKESQERWRKKKAFKNVDIKYL